MVIVPALKSFEMAVGSKRSKRPFLLSAWIWPVNRSSILQAHHLRTITCLSLSQSRAQTPPHSINLMAAQLPSYTRTPMSRSTLSATTLRSPNNCTLMKRQAVAQSHPALPSSIQILLLKQAAQITLFLISLSSSRFCLLLFISTSPCSTSYMSFGYFPSLHER